MLLHSAHIGRLDPELVQLRPDLLIRLHPLAHSEPKVGMPALEVAVIGGSGGLTAVDHEHPLEVPRSRSSRSGAAPPRPHDVSCVPHTQAILESANALGSSQPSRSRDAEWPVTAFESSAPTWAFYTLPLLLNLNSWVHRRVEQVVYLDEALIRRRQSIDLTIPNFFTKSVTAPFPLPLGFLRKAPLISFDLRSESGAALPLLTMDQNIYVAKTMLTAFAQASVEEAGYPSLDNDVKTWLEHLVGDDLNQAAVAATRLSDPTRSDAGTPTDTAAQAKIIWEVEQLQPLLKDLAKFYVLFAWVEASDAHVLARRVIKIAYVESLNPDSWSQTQAPSRWKRWTQRLRVGWERLIQRVGITPTSLELTTPAVGSTHSYHIEVCAPDGLEVSNTVLKLQPPEGELIVVKGETGIFGHAHVAGQRRGTDGVLTTDLTLTSSGIVMEAFLISLLTSAVLWIGLVLHWRNIHARPDYAAIVLVALPGIFATYLARPGEHPLVHKLVAGLRVLIAASALLSFAAAGVLVLDLRSDVHLWSWFAFAIASSLITAVIRLTKLKAAERQGRNLTRFDRTALECISWITKFVSLVGDLFALSVFLSRACGWYARAGALAAGRRIKKLISLVGDVFALSVFLSRACGWYARAGALAAGREVPRLLKGEAELCEDLVKKAINAAKRRRGSD
jgi:hypothetical protein